MGNTHMDRFDGYPGISDLFENSLSVDIYEQKIERPSLNYNLKSTRIVAGEHLKRDVEIVSPKGASLKLSDSFLEADADSMFSS